MLLLALACSDPKPVALAPGVQRNAIVVVVDTLRADALDHADTPTFDALTARGYTPERAWSSGTWTAPSIMSLLTGMTIREHGWDQAFPRFQENRDKSYPPMNATPTLPEVLRDAGFETTGFYANQVLSWDLGFDRGFGRWEHHSDRAMAEVVQEAVEGWSVDERHFLYVHYRGPHQPLKPSKTAREKHGLTELFQKKRRGVSVKWARKSEENAELYRRAYWAETHDVDWRLGKLLDTLGPHLEDTLLIVTSDHGEMLGESNRLGHEAWVDEPLTQIPFVMVNSTATPRLVTLDDVPHLVTSAVGLPHTWPETGGPLVSQRQGKLALSTDGHWKGQWENSTLSVYDLSGDAMAPVAAPGDASTQLGAARTSWESQVPAGIARTDKVTANAALMEALEVLGYVDGAEDAP